MWILDLAPHNGAVDIWEKEGGEIRCRREPVPAPFLFSLQDPHLHWQMIEALERETDCRECTFSTLHGRRTGYSITAPRHTAELIEQQTHYTAEVFNVDIRPEQRLCAAFGVTPCAMPGEGAFTISHQHPLTTLEIAARGRPYLDHHPESFQVGNTMIRGRWTGMVASLLEEVFAADPDVIFFPHADVWTAAIARTAEVEGLPFSFSRNGRYRQMQESSYESYGKTRYRPGAIIPEGRVLIDTAQSFNYREGGLAGVLALSRLTALPPNLICRLTPGSLISGYEVFEALKRGIAVPFRKGDPETPRAIKTVREVERGGIILQPEPGIYSGVTQLDFTSFYPTIIVRHNLSPETIDRPDSGQGFLPSVLDPLLRFRIETKRQKKTDPSVAGIDAVLKWMLVTSFGYTGYKNAKFGRIEVHEQITAIARDILSASRRIAESMDYSVLHGLVDALWVAGDGDIRLLQQRIEEHAEVMMEAEHYDWVVFLPQSDGSGAYTSYFGRRSDSRMRVRGVMGRRQDTPEYIRRMQNALFEQMEMAESPADLGAMYGSLYEIYEGFVDGLREADPTDLAIRRDLSSLDRKKQSLEASAVAAYRNAGADLSPGMAVRYVVADAGRHQAVPVWDAEEYDHRYYRRILAQAWEEAAFGLRAATVNRNAQCSGRQPLMNQEIIEPE
ncbi:type B DNA-directed DNA polymerase [Methanofollis fontis]|uniref:DNA-directed DNA polymerase n=1 Tax=Methanofollis fontis TaxID=2052832 RepID=A0A483CSU2_9EURY|nr:type B DNA-directed DNA polymerase [Methanofollis fontis]TAJ44271.1 DNA polymerase I [Methanofollis fontis]